MTTAKKFVIIFAVLLTLLCGGLLIYAQLDTPTAISASDFFPRLFPSPSLELSGDPPYQLPVITGIEEADEITAKLAQYYAPVIDTLHGANADGDIAATAFELCDIGDGQYRLKARIDAACGISIDLPDVALSDSGDILTADLPDLSYLSDSGFARGYFALMTLGMDADTARISDSVTNSEMCALMVDYYERMTGAAVDISRFSSSKEGSGDFFKALRLGLCPDNYLYYGVDDCAAASQLADASAQLLRELSFEYAGHGSQSIDTDELFRCTILLARIYDLISDSNYDISMRGKVVQALISAQGSLEPQSELSRADIAQIYSGVYEDIFGEISYDYSSIIQSDVDETDTAVCKAAYKNLLPDTPQSGLFSPEHIVNADSLPDTARQFADRCYCEWWFAAGGIADTSVSYGDVVTSIGLIDEYLRRFPRPITAPIEVINDREYDWYMSQHDTGRYSAVNCMPAITAMAIKWYDGGSDISVRQVRERLLDDSDGGWYMSQVTDSLDHYGIPHSQCEDIADGITHELSRGHIILTQQSEKPYDQSGHCFVIYGYRKVGDSVRYYIHDPDVSYDSNIYGEPAGKGMVFDSAYAEWIIGRITFYFVSVGD